MPALWIFVRVPISVCQKFAILVHQSLRVPARRGGRCSHHVVYKLIYKSKDCIFTLLIYPSL